MRGACETEDDVYGAILGEFDQSVAPGQDSFIHFARCVIKLLRLLNARGDAVGEVVTNGLILALALSQSSRDMALGGLDFYNCSDQDRSKIRHDLNIELLEK